MKKLLDQNDFVLQKHDPDFNEPVNIDVDDAILDKSVVMVAFIERKNPGAKATPKEEAYSINLPKTPILEFDSIKQLTDHIEHHGGLASGLESMDTSSMVRCFCHCLASHFPK